MKIEKANQHESAFGNCIYLLLYYFGIYNVNMYCILLIDLLFRNIIICK